MMWIGKYVSYAQNVIINGRLEWATARDGGLSINITIFHFDGFLI